MEFARVEIKITDYDITVLWKVNDGDSMGKMVYHRDVSVHYKYTRYNGSANVDGGRPVRSFDNLFSCEFLKQIGSSTIEDLILTSNYEEENSPLAGKFSMSKNRPEQPDHVSSSHFGEIAEVLAVSGLLRVKNLKLETKCLQKDLKKVVRMFKHLNVLKICGVTKISMRKIRNIGIVSIIRKNFTKKELMSTLKVLHNSKNEKLQITMPSRSVNRMKTISEEHLSRFVEKYGRKVIIEEDGVVIEKVSQQ